MKLKLILVFLLFGIACKSTFSQISHVYYNTIHANVEIDLTITNAYDFADTYIGSTESNVLFTFQDIVVKHLDQSLNLVSGSKISYTVSGTKRQLRLFAMTEMIDGRPPQIGQPVHPHYIVLSGYVVDPNTGHHKLVVIWLDKLGTYQFSKVYDLGNTDYNLFGLSIVAMGENNDEGLMIAGIITQSKGYNLIDHSYNAFSFAMTLGQVGGVLNYQTYTTLYAGFYVPPNYYQDDFDMINRIFKYHDEGGCHYVLAGRANRETFYIDPATQNIIQRYKNDATGIIISVDGNLNYNWHNVYDDDNLDNLHMDCGIDLLDNDDHLILLTNSSQFHTFYLSRVDKSTGALSDIRYFSVSIPILAIVGQSYGYSISKSKSEDKFLVAGIVNDNTTYYKGALFFTEIDRANFTVGQSWVYDVDGDMANNFNLDYYSARYRTAPTLKYFTQDIMYFNEFFQMPTIVGGRDLYSSSTSLLTGTEIITYDTWTDYPCAKQDFPIYDLEMGLFHQMTNISIGDDDVYENDILLDQSNISYGEFTCESDYEPMNGEPEQRKAHTPTLNNNENVMVYPNPANEFIYFRDNNIESVKVSDMLGRLVLESSVKDIKQMNIHTLPNGTYMVKVKTKDAVSNYKIEIHK